MPSAPAPYLAQVELRQLRVDLKTLSRLIMISERTIYRKMQDPIDPFPFDRIGEILTFSLHDVEAWIRRQGKEPPETMSRPPVPPRGPRKARKGGAV